MIQSTLLLDSSAAMGTSCPELPPTKAIGLRPHLAAFTSAYLNASPLALLSVISMRDGTATTLSPFTSNEDALLEALETKFFMMPPSGMMSLENGLRLAGLNMRLPEPPKKNAQQKSPSSSSAGTMGTAKVEGATSSSTSLAAPSSSSGTNQHQQQHAVFAPHRRLTAEEEATMDRTDVECALRGAVEQDEVEAGHRRAAGGEASETVPTSVVNSSSGDLSASGAVDDAKSKKNSPIAQRRIIVVTGAVTVLDPTNVFAVINGLARNNVMVDVISLMGAPHILVELARQTKGTFMCPMSGGGDQLRRQLLSCATLKKKKGNSPKTTAPNALANSADAFSSSLIGVKRERAEDGEEDDAPAATSDGLAGASPRLFGGDFTVRSQSNTFENGSVAIGFPVTSLEVLLASSNGSASAGGTAAPSSSASALLAMAVPSQPLCSRCYNPVEVPSVCAVCGLLACALPQIHKAFLGLDAQQDEDADKGGSSSASPCARRELPTLLAPSQYVVLSGASVVPSSSFDAMDGSAVAAAVALCPRCACCGAVLATTMNGGGGSILYHHTGADGHASNDSDKRISACECVGCGGIRCLACDVFVKETLKMCPTCVGC